MKIFNILMHVCFLFAVASNVYREEYTSAMWCLWAWLWFALHNVCERRADQSRDDARRWQWRYEFANTCYKIIQSQYCNLKDRLDAENNKASEMLASLQCRRNATAIPDLISDAINAYADTHAKKPTCILMSEKLYQMLCLECEKLNLTPIQGYKSSAPAKFNNIRIVRTSDLSANTPLLEVI